MKGLILVFTGIALLVIIFSASAQMMGSSLPADDQTAREEVEGKALWQKLQNKEINCDALSDDNFGALGEYFMGQMMGDSHAAMNQMMIRMMGEEGEEQMHVVMGKRLSGCDPAAAYPNSGTGFMPMMNMMFLLRQGFGGQVGGGFNMMNWGSGVPIGGWGMPGLGGVFMLLWWVLIVAGIVLLVKWLMNQGRGQASTTTALDILKARYARGEIDKKEFEEKKKDIS
ncbi:MAG: Membrane protein-like protein [Parcubacteria group bacterium GW2011_GWA2_45_14]|nr:MAG: Membrane protein-like protein [Parcubacteria group bacterium GW2011_GWA2_45_14]